MRTVMQPRLLQIGQHVQAVRAHALRATSRWAVCTLPCRLRLSICLRGVLHSLCRTVPSRACFRHLRRGHTGTASRSLPVERRGLGCIRFGVHFGQRNVRGCNQRPDPLSTHVRVGPVPNDLRMVRLGTRACHHRGTRLASPRRQCHALHVSTGRVVLPSTDDRFGSVYRAARGHSRHGAMDVEPNVGAASCSGRYCSRGVSSKPHHLRNAAFCVAACTQPTSDTGTTDSISNPRSHVLGWFTHVCIS